MDDNYVLIHVLAGHSSTGPVLEELPATRISTNKYRLLASPGLALDIAKGDVIELNKDKKAIIIERGGNFCIQIYADKINLKDIEKLERSIRSSLNGSIDGSNNGNLAITIPSSNGIDKINSVFDDFKNNTGIQWYYANIYLNPDNPNDETLSNWWLK